MEAVVAAGSSEDWDYVFETAEGGAAGYGGLSGSMYQLWKLMLIWKSYGCSGQVSVMEFA